MATNYNTFWNNSRIVAAFDSSTHNNERIITDNIFQPIPSLYDSSTLRNCKKCGSLDSFEPAKVTVEKDQSAVDASILLEIGRTMKKHMDNLHHVLEGVGAQLTQLETRTHHLESSMDDLKVSIGNNHGITYRKLMILEKILHEVQNIKEKQEIVQPQLQLAKLQVSKTEQQSETQTIVISDPVQQASSVYVSAPLQCEQYLPSQQGLPPPIQSQEIPNQQLYQLPLTQQTHPPQPGAPPHQQYQQTPHTQYSQPPPHLPPHSSMSHHLEQPPYVPSQNYPPNLRQPSSQPHSGPPPPPQWFYGTLPQGYEPLSSKAGASYSSGYSILSWPAEPNRYEPPSGRPPSSRPSASYSSGYGTLSGPAEPNRFGRPSHYGIPPQGYEPPSGLFGASYSGYGTSSEPSEPNRYDGPSQYGGKPPHLPTTSVASNGIACQYNAG